MLFWSCISKDTDRNGTMQNMLASVSTCKIMALMNSKLYTLICRITICSSLSVRILEANMVLGFENTGWFWISHVQIPLNWNRHGRRTIWAGTATANKNGSFYMELPLRMGWNTKVCSYNSSATASSFNSVSPPYTLPRPHLTQPI